METLFSVGPGQSNPVLFNGVVYRVVHDDLEDILAYDVEAGTWEVLNLSIEDDDLREYLECPVEGIYLLVCNSNLMMVVDNGCQHLLKVDLVSNRLLGVAIGPARAVREGKFEAAQKPIALIWY